MRNLFLFLFVALTVGVKSQELTVSSGIILNEGFKKNLYFMKIAVVDGDTVPLGEVDNETTYVRLFDNLLNKGDYIEFAHYKTGYKSAMNERNFIRKINGKEVLTFIPSYPIGYFAGEFLILYKNFLYIETHAAIYSFQLSNSALDSVKDAKRGSRIVIDIKERKQRLMEPITKDEIIFVEDITKYDFKED